MARFDQFDIVLTVSGKMRRIAKVKFYGDGSIFVFFPSFSSTQGILSRVKILGGTTYPSNVDLTKGGKVASHLVKYAHHPDGEVHFSQDGKVETVIRRKAAPLAEQFGHLFTIQAQDFDSFPIREIPQKKQLTFNIGDDVVALRLVAWRFRLADLNSDGIMPPDAIPIIRMSDGIDRAGLIVAPPEGLPFDEFALFFTIQPMPAIATEMASQLLFLGGFDPTSVALNHAKDTEFLAFAYPCSEYETLKNSIGTIDFVTKA
jgi:hypothetical protein